VPAHTRVPQFEGELCEPAACKATEDMSVCLRTHDKPQFEGGLCEPAF